MNGCTSGASGGDVMDLVGISTGVVFNGRGCRNRASKFSMCVRITGSTGEVDFLFQLASR